MSIIFLIKLLLVPLLIGLVTLAGRRWGPKIGGWLSSFPIIAGPILFFIACDRGSEFAVTAAVGTMSAVMAIIVFSLAYSWAALRMDWVGSLLAALFFYAIAALGLSVASLSIYSAATISILSITIAPRLFPSVTHHPVSIKTTAYDLPLRMLLSASLVLLITYSAQKLGPHLSGILVMFPVLTGILSVFSHRSAGKEFTINFLKGTTLGWYSFVMFCFTLALLLQSAPISSAFFFATLAALVIQLISRRFIDMHR